MSKESDLIKTFRNLPGAHNFFPELCALVAKTDYNIEECYLCRDCAGQKSHKILREKEAEKRRYLSSSISHIDIKRKNLSDEKIEEIVKNIGSIKGAKKVPRKTVKKKSTNQKARIVRTKFNKTPRTHRPADEDTTSLEGNKFHKRFRKTKRNVRV